MPTATRPKRTKPAGGFAHSLVRDAQEYMRALKTENDRLRALVSALEAHGRHLSAWAAAERGLAKGNAAIRKALVTRETQVAKQDQLLATLRRQIKNHQREYDDLREQAAAVAADNAKSSGRCADLEREVAKLAGLYAATYRLHESLDVAGVLDAVREIVNALVGSEEFAVVERAPGSNTLKSLAVSGVEQAQLDAMTGPDGVVTSVMRTGRIFVAESLAIAGVRRPGDGVTACIPLRFDENVVGAIIVFRLLPQKRRLESADREVFELLATQTAKALHLARLHNGRWAS